VQPATSLRSARRRAGLTQRGLAARAAVPQSVIARLESGRVVPRVDTIDHLLRACGWALEVVPRAGADIDRTALRELLALTPRERLVAAAADAAGIEALDRARRS
jgi:predicted transcriptional regulator